LYKSEVVAAAAVLELGDRKTLWDKKYSRAIRTEAPSVLDGNPR